MSVKALGFPRGHLRYITASGTQINCLSTCWALPPQAKKCLLLGNYCPFSCFLQPSARWVLISGVLSYSPLCVSLPSPTPRSLTGLLEMNAGRAAGSKFAFDFWTQTIVNTFHQKTDIDFSWYPTHRYFLNRLRERCMKSILQRRQQENKGGVTFPWVRQGRANSFVTERKAVSKPYRI